jgi:hypothetical protein
VSIDGEGMTGVAEDMESDGSDFEPIDTGHDRSSPSME